MFIVFRKRNLMIIIIIIISVLFGILLSIDLSEMLDPARIESNVIVEALDNVMEHFYSQRTSIVFIMEQSTLSVNSGLKPIEVAGELVRMESDRISMTYVIENPITLKQMSYQRFYNIFLIDSFESFR